VGNSIKIFRGVNTFPQGGDFQLKEFQLLRIIPEVLTWCVAASSPSSCHGLLAEEFEEQHYNLIKHKENPTARNTTARRKNSTQQHKGKIKLCAEKNCRA